MNKVVGVIIVVVKKVVMDILTEVIGVMKGLLVKIMVK